jgi:phosphate transport system substrate-binding protein
MKGKRMNKFILALAILVMSVNVAEARNHLQIVGSSTVFPFATAAAEGFAKSSGHPAPVIESTGSGGGMKLFCAGIGVGTPDITNASRQIKQSEVDLCKSNGVTPIEYKIGYDGIVLGSSKKADPISLTKEQLWKAVAKNVWLNGRWVANPYRKWSDIDKSLPNTEILIYGPPPTSGTRDAFVELVSDHVCRKVYGMDKKTAKAECRPMREDGRFVEAGENDNLMVQKLQKDKHAFGIFGFSFLDQNEDSIQGAKIDGALPTFDAIADGSYAISRSLFFYAKKEHVEFIPGMKEFIDYFMSDKVIGKEGIAVDKGLIPLG